MTNVKAIRLAVEKLDSLVDDIGNDIKPQYRQVAQKKFKFTVERLNRLSLRFDI